MVQKLLRVPKRMVRNVFWKCFVNGNFGIRSCLAIACVCSEGIYGGHYKELTWCAVFLRILNCRSCRYHEFNFITGLYA
jgi:hypothetical protein